MTFNEYQQQSYVNIQPHTDYKDEVLNWSTGLTEEVGETISHIKHHFWGHENLNHVLISKEIGDILWYLSALCTSLNINLDTVANLNLKKLKHRYNTSFTDTKSKLRHKIDKEFTETSEYVELINKLKLNK